MGGTVSREQQQPDAVRGVPAADPVAVPPEDQELQQQGDRRVQRHLLGDIADRAAAVAAAAAAAEAAEAAADQDNLIVETGEGGSGGGSSRRGGRRGLKRRKRKRVTSGDENDEDEEEEEEEDEFDEILHTPKKRKLRTTSRYIYQTLFLEGRESDVIVTALNREWKLHKLYLCQSLYFQSMFSGSWRESTMDRIEIQVADDNVTLDALHVALGSLYQDEISVEPAEVIPILAAANLFQLEGLIDQCVIIMEETINVKTVVRYYETALRYGVSAIKKSCLSWLKVNLLSHMPEHPDRLRDIPPELMAHLVESPELFVMQTEFSVYVLLRLWLYLKFHETWDGNPQDAVLKSHKYFQDRVKATKRFFLETAEGRPYVNVFKSLRLNHLVNHHMDMEMLLTDRIIPRQWMYPVYQNQWRLLLRTDQGIDKGPQHLNPGEFDRACLRCGRTLNVEGQQHMWRWTGFGMGLDLIVTYNVGFISLKRNLGTASSAGGEHEALLSNHKKRHLYFRVSVVSLNDQKQVVYRATSGVQSVSMGRNSSHEVLKIDTSKAKFPLLLSFNFVVNTPLSEEFTDEEDEEAEAEAAVAEAASVQRPAEVDRGLTNDQQQQGANNGQQQPQPPQAGQQPANDVVDVPA